MCPQQHYLQESSFSSPNVPTAATPALPCYLKQALELYTPPKINPVHKNDSAIFNQWKGKCERSEGAQSTVRVAT